MLERLSAPVSGATKPIAVDGSETSSTAESGTDWFRHAAKAILGKDAGLHLHHITGFPERSCYYYASGDRPPPAYFLQVLFHSDHGEPFFHAFMEGCQANWWADHRRARRIAQAIDNAE